MPRRSWTLPAFVMCIWLALTFAPTTAAQSGANLLEMQVSAAYNGFFRADYWLPLRVTLENNADALVGEVVVRPARNVGLSATYSLTVDLAPNTRKADVLYVNMDSIATSLVVEFIDSASGAVLLERTVPLRALVNTDHLYVVLTQAASGSIDLTAAHAPGMNAVQSNWTLNDIPDRAPALNAANMLVFTAIDSGGMSLAQESAIGAWVANGGHLLVTGGASWQATAAAFTDLLPLQVRGTQTLEDVSGLAGFINTTDTLRAQTVVSVGELIDGAQVLAQAADGTPLLVRRVYGEGTVDYLAADPNSAPLRGWAGLSPLVHRLAVTADPVPTWTGQVSRWAEASAASEVLPGIDLLPSVLPILGFLALYIALLGPLNYVLLNRINRRELAWLTIPALIAVFSLLAYALGSSLRGTAPSIGRVTLVRSWQDVPFAHSTELVGLLSPQRTRYTLTADPAALLRPMPRSAFGVGSVSLLSATFQSTTSIQQLNGFRAQDFPVDASFVAGFVTQSTVAPPPISGQAVIFYAQNNANQLRVRGSVRNDSQETLYDALILARGTPIRFTEPIEAGEVVTFDAPFALQEAPAPAPIGKLLAGSSNLSFTSSYIENTDISTRQIIGENNYSYNPLFPNAFPSDGDDPLRTQEIRRRQLFLMSLMQEPHLSTARGNQVYLAAWGSAPQTALSLQERDYTPYASTLYLVALNSTVERPLGRSVHVSADQFAWSVFEKDGIVSESPVNLNVPDGNRIAFEFVPLQTARLDTVERVYIYAQRTSGSNLSVPIAVYNWQAGTWDDFVITGERLVLDEPAPYVSAQNSVVVRVVGTGNLSLTLRQLSVEQEGRFAS